jgi:predicted AAA+ superfamily ATPase
MQTVFLKLNEQYPALLITGPRQVGKTTMLQKLLETEGRRRRYVSLDDLNERALAKSDPAMFFQLHKPPVFIDEVQYAPELFTYIKIHIDKYQTPGDFWLTGSQLFKLMQGVQESLAGRVALLHLSPLSQQEIYGGPLGAFSPDFHWLSLRRESVKPILAAQVLSDSFGEYARTGQQKIQRPQCVLFRLHQYTT